MGIWDEYRQKRVVQLSLDEIGLPQFWVRIRHPGSLTPAEHIELNYRTNNRLDDYQTLVAKSLGIGQPEEPPADAAEDAENPEAAPEEQPLSFNEDAAREADELDALLLPHIAECILSWNLVDTIEEKSLEVPSVDPTVSLQLPLEVVSYINTKIQDMFEEAKETPKVSETS